MKHWRILMIETYQLTKIFDNFIAVNEITLKVNTGEVLALLGPNGAGKTTTVRMMTSILAPTGGWVKIANYDTITQSEQVRHSVGVLTEQHGLYERMVGLEYLDFFGEVYHMDKVTCRKRAKELMERFGLADALNRRVGDYSKGMKQKLALVRALLHNPPVLLLDEPTSAMDPLSAKQVRDAIIELQQEERTFLITTHNLNEAQQLANKIAIIRHGRIIASGTFEELSKQFVGDTLVELTISGKLENPQACFEGMIVVEDAGENWLRYRTTTVEQTNPQVLKRAIELGMNVVSLIPLIQNLEDIYLQVVKEDEQKG
jgi:ABC-2 type transport system ATP-binding protein